MRQFGSQKNPGGSTAIIPEFLRIGFASVVSSNDSDLLILQEKQPFHGEFGLRFSPVHGASRNAVVGPPFTAGRSPTRRIEPRSRGFSMFGLSMGPGVVLKRNREKPRERGLVCRVFDSCYPP